MTGLFFWSYEYATLLVKCPYRQNQLLKHKVLVQAKNDVTTTALNRNRNWVRDANAKLWQFDFKNDIKDVVKALQKHNIKINNMLVEYRGVFKQGRLSSVRHSPSEKQAQRHMIFLLFLSSTYLSSYTDVQLEWTLVPNMT